MLKVLKAAFRHWAVAAFVTANQDTQDNPPITRGGRRQARGFRGTAVLRGERPGRLGWDRFKSTHCERRSEGESKMIQGPSRPAVSPLRGQTREPLGARG